MDSIIHRLKQNIHDEINSQRIQKSKKQKKVEALAMKELKYDILYGDYIYSPLLKSSGKLTRKVTKNNDNNNIDVSLF